MTPEEEFARLMSHIGERPDMYVQHGTFAEVVAYLTGYLSGSRLRLSEHKMGDGLAPFTAWLSERFGSKDRLNWDKLILQHCGGDEARALRELGPLFGEFRTQRNKATH